MILTEDEEVDCVNQDVLFELTDAERRTYYESTGGNKLGGSPCFIQQEEFPFSPDKSQLVLQLDQSKVPFHVEFGDTTPVSPNST